MDNKFIKNKIKEFLFIYNQVLNKDYSNYRNLSFLNDLYLKNSSIDILLNENNTINNNDDNLNKEYEAVTNCLHILNIYINIDNYKADKELIDKVNELRKCLISLRRIKTTDLFLKQHKNLYIEICFLSLSNLYLKLNEVDKANETLYLGYKQKYFYCFYNYILDACEDLFFNSKNIIYSFINSLYHYFNDGFLKKYFNQNNQNLRNNISFNYENKLAKVIINVSRYLENNDLKEEYEYFNINIRTILHKNNINLNIPRFAPIKEDNNIGFFFSIPEEKEYEKTRF